MLQALILTGLICSLSTAELSELDDLFSSFISNNNNNKVITSNTDLKTKKNTKTANVHKPFEMSFPLFYDLFPMGGFEGKTKDPLKLYQEDKDPIPEGGEQRSFSKIFKSKKKPKDKVIMSFTEFFVPFSSRKSNFDISGIPKKFDFFEEFFKDFPFKEFEEPILKHRIQRRVLNNTNSSKGSIFENIFMFNNTNNETEPKMNLLFHKPQKVADIYEFNSALENSGESKGETAIRSCCGHPECKMHGHCQLGMCTHKSQEGDENNSSREKEVAKIIETINMDKLIKVALLYTVPIMIGIGGIIIAIEVVKKHKNVVKNTKILRDYDPLQRC